ncbi:hypothetical protein A3Q37_04456 [Streptomyces sp. PTY087I2]|nr:hypothetical protein A3Q37_04456 [Streptomyces sp. PTY087I2]
MGDARHLFSRGRRRPATAGSGRVGGGGEAVKARRLIGDLTAKLCRARLTEPGVGKYLKRWGLPSQRSDTRAVQQDPQAVRRWHEETWPAIQVRAKAEGGEALFTDQVTGRTWGQMGKTPVVRRSGNRFSTNAMSASRTKGRKHSMIFAESFTAEVMGRFLDRLAGHFEHKTHLVVDGNSARRSRKGRDWSAAHPDEAP